MAKKITAFTRANIGTFSADLHAAIQAVAAKHGVSIDFDTVRYQDTQYSTKMTVKVLGADGETQLSSSLLGLMDIMGIQQHGTHGRKIVDYRSRSRKAPWIFTIESQPGKRFVASDAQAKIYFAKKA